MAAISNARIQQYLAESDAAATHDAKGNATEELLSYIFGRVPGLTNVQKNRLTVQGHEEIDLVFWNDQKPTGFPFLPTRILIESKDCASRVGSHHVSVFNQKIQNRFQTFGILYAANGITGNAQDLTHAHQVITLALSHGREIIVITRDEIAGLTTTQELVALMKHKLTQLTATGTSID